MNASASASVCEEASLASEEDSLSHELADISDFFLSSTSSSSAAVKTEPVEQVAPVTTSPSTPTIHHSHRPQLSPGP